MTTDILIRPSNLQIFRVEKKPLHISFFLVQNISKTTNVFLKIVGIFCKLYQVIVTYKKSEICDYVYLKLHKKLISRKKGLLPL